MRTCLSSAIVYLSYSRALNSKCIQRSRTTFCSVHHDEEFGYWPSADRFIYCRRGRKGKFGVHSIPAHGIQFSDLSTFFCFVGVAPALLCLGWFDMNGRCGQYPSSTSRSFTFTSFTPPTRILSTAWKLRCSMPSRRSSWLLPLSRYVPVLSKYLCAFLHGSLDEI